MVVVRLVSGRLFNLFRVGELAPNVGAWDTDQVIEALVVWHGPSAGACCSPPSCLDPARSPRLRDRGATPVLPPSGAVDGSVGARDDTIRAVPNFCCRPMRTCDAYGLDCSKPCLKGSASTLPPLDHGARMTRGELVSTVLVGTVFVQVGRVGAMLIERRSQTVLFVIKAGPALLRLALATATPAETVGPDLASCCSHGPQRPPLLARANRGTLMARAIVRTVRAPFWDHTHRRARTPWLILIPLIGAFVAASAETLVPFELPLPVAALLASGVPAVVAVLLVMLSRRFLGGRRLADYGLVIDRPWLIDLGAGLVVGLLAVSIPFLVALGAGWAQVAATFDPGEMALWPGILLYTVAMLCTGFWEELVLRGVFLCNAVDGLHRWLSPTAPWRRHWPSAPSCSPWATSDRPARRSPC